MNGTGKSDSSVVPARPPNKAGPTAAEAVEGRGLTKGNPNPQNVLRTQSRERTRSAWGRVREAAEKDRKARFTALYHHVANVDALRHAYYCLQKEASPGVDGVTWEEYGKDLERKLEDLAARLKRGAYRARPVRRTYIPKADGRQRPLGVTTLEDKLVQLAVVGVLNAIYETEFLGFSYGFRPKRRQHDALDAVVVGLDRRNVNWVLDADIRGFFDNISREWLVKFLEHRIGDRRIVRLIQKWLNAGVLEDGKVAQVQKGTPQGGSISPLLANIYLHYVLDTWIQAWRRRHARGDVIIVRYADDFIMGFQHKEEAERLLVKLRERFAKFGLELHSEKTRLIEFGRYAARKRRGEGLGKPETFNFLGFTHISGEDRNGNFQVRRITMRNRARAKLKAVAEELRKRMHEPIPTQGAWLGTVVKGHTAYYGVPLNTRAIRNFRYRVAWHWRRTLSKRSQHGHVTWATMNKLMQKWLPAARISHPFPNQRLSVTTRGRSPVR